MNSSATQTSTPKSKSASRAKKSAAVKADTQKPKKVLNPSSISEAPKMKKVSEKVNLSQFSDEFIDVLVKNRRPTFMAMWNEVMQAAQTSLRIGVLTVRSVL